MERKTKKSYGQNFVVSDSYSNCGWCLLSKNKTSETITNQFFAIFYKSNRKANLIESEDGKDFPDKIFTEYQNSKDTKDLKYKDLKEQLLPKNIKEQSMMILENQSTVKELLIGLMNHPKHTQKTK